MVYFSVWHSFRFFHNYYIEASKSASKDMRMRKRAIIHTSLKVLQTSISEHHKI